ncbi:MAG: hypothetical protein WCW68_13525 [Methanothrix sp.]
MSKKVYGLLLLAFISIGITTVQGTLEVKVVAGNSNGEVGLASRYGASTNDVVTQDIEVRPVNGDINNHWYFTGSGSGSRSAYGSGGSHAQSGFTVEGLSGRTGTWYEFTSSNYPARTTESLTSTNAHRIYAWGKAWNSEGDYARGYIEAHDYIGCYDSNLYNYRNTAYATSNYATVTQAADSARGDWYVKAYQYADDYWDDSYVSWKGKKIYKNWNGYNYGYYGSSQASRSTDYTRTWQYVYGYAYPSYLRSYAYQNYGPKTFYDADNWYGTHGYKQWSSTGTTSGLAYNQHTV